MPLPLVNPIGGNFLKDWPAQNAVNCDAIDGYAGPALATNALQTYTPVLSAVTTDPTLGTGGFIRGFYYQIFDQIYVFGEMRFGTAGTNAGSGIYTISLPFTADTSVVPANSSLGSSPVIGNGLVWNNVTAATRQLVTVHLRTASLMHFGISINSGMPRNEVASAIPIAWTINDGMQWSGRYKRLP
jgi:hypothetical protein